MKGWKSLKGARSAEEVFTEKALDKGTKGKSREFQWPIKLNMTGPIA